MDAITLINDKVDMLKLLEYYSFDGIREDKTMIRSCCKLHGGNNPSAFVVNAESKLWYCHTSSCGGGDAYSLVQKLEGCDFKTAVQRIASLFNVNISTLQINERKDTHINEMQKWIKMMKKRAIPASLTPIDLNSHLSTPPRQVLKFRSFHEDTLSLFTLQYAESFICAKSDGGVYTLNHRLLIPIHNPFGVQVGVSLRATRAGDMPKWSHQPQSIKTSNMLYNYDRVYSEDVIAVCEGIFDVWAMHEVGIPAVCTYGAHLTDAQYALLIKSSADIVLAYDGDDAGRGVTSKAAKMLHNKANVSIINFDQGQDPENITREELKIKYEHRTKAR